jgi:hypothetical protein
MMFESINIRVHVIYRKADHDLRQKQVNSNQTSLKTGIDFIKPASKLDLIIRGSGTL